MHDLGKFDPSMLRACRRHLTRTSGSAQGDTFDQVRTAIDLGVDSLEYIDRSTAPGYPPEIIPSLKSLGRSMFLVPPIGYYRRYVSFRSDGSVLDSDRLTAMIVGSDCGSTASFQADAIWWELETWRRFGASSRGKARSRVRGRRQVGWTLVSSARR